MRFDIEEKRALRSGRIHGLIVGLIALLVVLVIQISLMWEVTRDRSPRITIASLSEPDPALTPPWGYRVLGRQTAEYAAMLERITGLETAAHVPRAACRLHRLGYQCVDQMVLCNRMKKRLEEAGAPYEFMTCHCDSDLFYEILREMNRVEHRLPKHSPVWNSPDVTPVCEIPPLPTCPTSWNPNS